MSGLSLLPLSFHSLQTLFSIKSFHAFLTSAEHHGLPWSFPGHSLDLSKSSVFQSVNPFQGPQPVSQNLPASLLLSQSQNLPASLPDLQFPNLQSFLVRPPAALLTFARTLPRLRGPFLPLLSPPFYCLSPRTCLPASQISSFPICNPF